MNDTISRQAAIDALESGKDKTAKGDIGGFYNTIIQNDIDKLKNLPSAQPEIIYCRECKHFNDYFVECDHESGLKHIKDDHDHCSYAERRTDV